MCHEAGELCPPVSTVQNIHTYKNNTPCTGGGPLRRCVSVSPSCRCAGPSWPGLAVVLHPPLGLGMKLAHELLQLRPTLLLLGGAGQPQLGGPQARVPRPPAFQAIQEPRGRRGRGGAGGARPPHLQARLLHGELAVHADTFLPADFLQLVLVEREELRPGQDAQVLHDPGGAARGA